MPPKRTTSAKPPRRSVSKEVASPKAVPPAPKPSTPKAAAPKSRPRASSKTSGAIATPTPPPPPAPAKSTKSKSRARSAASASAPSPKASSPRGRSRKESVAAAAVTPLEALPDTDNNTPNKEEGIVVLKTEEAKKTSRNEEKESSLPQLPPPLAAPKGSSRSLPRASLPTIMSNARAAHSSSSPSRPLEEMFSADNESTKKATNASDHDLRSSGSIPYSSSAAAAPSGLTRMSTDLAMVTSTRGLSPVPISAAASASVARSSSAKGKSKSGSSKKNSPTNSKHNSSNSTERPQEQSTSTGSKSIDINDESRFDEYSELSKAVRGVADQIVEAVLGTEEERHARPRRTANHSHQYHQQHLSRGESPAANAAEYHMRQQQQQQQRASLHRAEKSGSRVDATAIVHHQHLLGSEANVLPISVRESGELTNEERRKLKEHVAREGVMTMRDYLHGAIDGCEDHDEDGGCETIRSSGVADEADEDKRASATLLLDYDGKAVEYDAHGRKISRPIKPEDGSLPLYTYEHAPAWMQHNPFILSAYRCHYSVDMCIRSLFTIHNETANVWTHLLGLVFFITLMIYCFMHIIKAEASHILIFLLFSLGNCLCMGCSAMFHLFSAHHCERVYSRMIMMDYFGITSLIIASFYPVCYYGFACNPFWRWMYLGIITALGSVGLIGPFFDFFLSDDFALYRLGIFCGLTGTGVFPLIHVNFIMPIHEATPFAQGIALMLFLYGAGVVVYVFKVPERLVPGRFDIWFHSHQLWHVFVLAASVVHFFTCLTTYMRWESMVIHC